MNLQSIRKISGSVALVCASLVFASEALASRVVVAKRGGNYTTITAALNGITPTATNPFVIEVWPGIYTEPGTVNMKSYVHLKGSGRDVTTVKTSLGTTANVISAIGLTNVTISGLTVTGGSNGIRAESTATASGSVTISDNTISNSWNYGIVTERGDRTGPTNSVHITGNNIINNGYSGIDLNRTTATISRNHISGTGSGIAYCGTSSCTAIFINMAGTETQIITDNVITGNKGVGIYACNKTNATMTNNIITDNAQGGIDFSYTDSTGTVTNNKIVNNGTLFADIVIKSTNTALPNISFNIFNSITGTGGVGSYNVNSNGDPILVP